MAMNTSSFTRSGTPCFFIHCETVSESHSSTYFCPNRIAGRSPMPNCSFSGLTRTRNADKVPERGTQQVDRETRGVGTINQVIEAEHEPGTATQNALYVRVHRLPLLCVLNNQGSTLIFIVCSLNKKQTPLKIQKPLPAMNRTRTGYGAYNVSISLLRRIATRPLSGAGNRSGNSKRENRWNPSAVCCPGIAKIMLCDFHCKRSRMPSSVNI